jgi:hypothetical protein
VEAFAGAVVRLLEDAPLRERLGQAAARDMGERFGWERLVETVERAYGVESAVDVVYQTHGHQREREFHHHTTRLPESRCSRIDAKIPRAIEVQRWLAATPPEWVDAKAGPESALSVALRCLHDAARVACEVDYALVQAFATVAWYREEHPEAPCEAEAVFYGKLYADDVALRLYSAREHIAEFILALLSIDKQGIAPYREKYDSCASAVGNYMRSKKPDHVITPLLEKLRSDPNWGKTMEYRNLWVHEQPPLVESPGIQYKRQSRWRPGPTPGIYMMGMGGDTWDRPDYTLDELLEMVSLAAQAFEGVLASLSEMLFKELEGLGIERDLASGSVEVRDLY